MRGLRVRVVAPVVVAAMCVAMPQVAHAGQGIGPVGGDVNGQMCHLSQELSDIGLVCVALNQRVIIPLPKGDGGSNRGGTCTGQSCDNTDPVLEQCDPSAYDAAQNDVYYGNGQHAGYVQNWYSVDCGTNYSRTVEDAPPCGDSSECGYSVWVSGPTATSDHYGDVTNQSIYSNQVYAPAHNCAYAYTFYDNGVYSGSGQANAC
jgi:hypothetical protein